MPKKILVVSDNKTIQQSAKKYLTGYDSEIIEATNGEIAVSFVFTESPDLIIADNDLKDMPGLKFVQKIKTEDNSKVTPVLVVLSKPDPAVQEMIRLGVTEFLVNPFEKSDLLEAIDRVIGGLGKPDEPTVNIEPKSKSADSDATVVLRPPTSPQPTPPVVEPSKPTLGFGQVNDTPPPVKTKAGEESTVILSPKDIQAELEASRKRTEGSDGPIEASQPKSIWGTLDSAVDKTVSSEVKPKSSVFGDTLNTEIEQPKESPMPTIKSVFGVPSAPLADQTIPSISEPSEEPKTEIPKIEIEPTAYEQPKSIFDAIPTSNKTPKEIDSTAVFDKPQEKIEIPKLDIEPLQITVSKKDVEPEEQPTVKIPTIELESELLKQKTVLEPQSEVEPVVISIPEIKPSEIKATEMKSFIDEKPIIETPSTEIQTQQQIQSEISVTQEPVSATDLTKTRCFMVKFNSNKNMMLLLRPVLDTMREEELDNFLASVVTEKKPAILFFEPSSVSSGSSVGLRSAVKSVLGDDAPVVIVKKENSVILNKLLETSGIKLVELNSVGKTK